MLEGLLVGVLIGLALCLVIKNKEDKIAALIREKAASYKRMHERIFEEKLTAAHSAFYGHRSGGQDLRDAFPFKFQASLEEVIKMSDEQLRARFDAQPAKYLSVEEDVLRCLPNEITERTQRELATLWMDVSDVELVELYEEFRRYEHDLIEEGLEPDEAHEEVWGDRPPDAK